MDYMKRIRCASNSYYNLGLERARIRDLSGAVECLKRSLHLNKYNTDARNLLGLIYYEIGEVSDALVQWVISMNLQPDGNRADYYLEQIQRRAAILDVVSQNVKKYNQALIHAQSGSDDLAVLQLTKVVETNPNFVKAHLLLAVLYMAHEDYTKAGKSLYKVLKIDKNNAKAQWYMSIVKSKTGRAEVERRKLKNAFSHRQMQDDDVIIPPTYKENTGLQSVLNIGAGLLLGAAMIFFLVMPAKVRGINYDHGQELVEFNEKLNQKNTEISSLTAQVEAYEEQVGTLSDQLGTIEGDNSSVLDQYVRVIGILQSYRNDDFDNAVELYVQLNPELITDAGVQAIVADIRSDMETNGYQVMEEMGDTMWNAGRMEEAINYYQKSLALHPDNPQILYNLGMIYRSQGNTELAIDYFNQVVTNHPASEQAERASERMAELMVAQPAAGGINAGAGTGAGENGGEGTDGAEGDADTGGDLSPAQRIGGQSAVPAAGQNAQPEVQMVEPMPDAVG